MKKLILFFALLPGFTCIAQTQDSIELQEKAKAYMRNGDYDNAVLLLMKALDQSPTGISISKDLALNYYFQKENTKALQVIKPLLDRNDVDDQSFQIAGNIYKAMEQIKDAEAMYKKALSFFSTENFSSVFCKKSFSDKPFKSFTTRLYSIIFNWSDGDVEAA